MIMISGQLVREPQPPPLNLFEGTNMTYPQTPPPYAQSAAPYQASQQVGPKSFLVTWLLSLLLGGLGIDRFYLGKIGTGILKLITFGGFGIWALIDLILVLANKQTDKQGFKLEGYEKHKLIAIIISVVVILIGGISSAVNGANAGSKVSSLSEVPAVATEAPVVEKTQDAAAAAAEASASTKASAEAKAQADADAKAAAEEATNRGTVGQQNAKAKAEDYLAFTAFSRSGLIKQLQFEKFPAADATWAVDHIKVDWNAQAAAKAKQYLDTTSFSRGSLIDQLVFEGFTQEQAAYGATKAGL